jgi:hypothetical protein
LFAAKRYGREEFTSEVALVSGRNSQRQLGRAIS